MFLERKQWFRNNSPKTDLLRKGVRIPERSAGLKAAWASVCDFR